MRVSAIVMVLLLATACASKLRPRDTEMDEPDAGEPEFRGEKSGKFTSRALDDGSTDTLVNAFVEEEWQQWDLDTGKEGTGERDWDMAFSRFRIKTNGGANGPGGVYVAALPEQSFEELKRAPVQGFAADREDSEEDTDTDPDNVFNSGDEDWYNYDVMRHELSPKNICYVLASSEGNFYKFVIDKYYDSAGTPAMMRFRWAAIDAPDGEWRPAAKE
jgi:HmuY protein